MKKEKKPRPSPASNVPDFHQLAAKWAKPFVKRADVKEFSCGLISGKTLANLAARGEGPPYFRASRYVVYQTTDLTEWFTDIYTPSKKRCKKTAEN